MEMEAMTSDVVLQDLRKSILAEPIKKDVAKKLFAICCTETASELGRAWQSSAALREACRTLKLQGGSKLPKHTVKEAVDVNDRFLKVAPLGSQFLRASVTQCHSASV